MELQIYSNIGKNIHVKTTIGRPVLDKGTSVVTFTTAAAMFPNADDYLSNWVEKPSQYN